MKFYKEEEGFLLSEAKITGHVSLGQNCHKPTIGRPKSGKDWKKGGKRAIISK